MNITIEALEKVMDETGVAYREAKAALLEADGDVEKAIANLTVVEADEVVLDADDTVSDDADEEPAFEEEPDDNIGRSFEDYIERGVDDADRIVERLKEKVKEGHVKRIKMSRDGKTILSIPLNIGLVGGLIGIAAVPWAVIFGAIAAYGLDCKFEIVKDDGTTEEVF